MNRDGTHACRRLSYTACVGAGNAGSAKAPTATPIASGLRSGSQNTVDPQCGQKWKFTAKPLSASRRNVRNSPFAFTSSREKNAAIP